MPETELRVDLCVPVCEVNCLFAFCGFRHHDVAPVPEVVNDMKVKLWCLAAPLAQTVRLVINCMALRENTRE